MARRQENGFTLVEVLVALLIFSTAIMGLMQASTQNIRVVQAVEQRQLAGMVADNRLLIAVNRVHKIEVGTQQNVTEMAGVKWAWIIRTSETGQAGFFKMVIDVRDERAEQIIVTRTAYGYKTPEDLE